MVGLVVVLVVVGVVVGVGVVVRVVGDVVVVLAGVVVLTDVIQAQVFVDSIGYEIYAIFSPTLALVFLDAHSADRIEYGCSRTVL